MECNLKQLSVCKLKAIYISRKDDLDKGKLIWYTIDCLMMSKHLYRLLSNMLLSIMTSL